MNEEKKPLQGSFDMQQYFSTLPTYVKESIEQSGIKFSSAEELRAFVSNLNRSK